ncbi:hypothetical protein Hydth_0560 [Hydrogenobacter thermophilus TK-6]|uniref:Uncharacterized protein n=1 Tax=Hydrogenobacter thermophilus (strain DSM 6534 / IAM 12695 / TK-6) TaxID=608538 RepID=D3DGS2_HYDTT|nr:hypothetical protein [Hydrogenobacter thermophilus]ADO44959.1 hypothetical protein Hydth_0560 [Hydrogenobacter thermophilus TK-6]BAI69024.1 hypothetical protein HTH_0562 [Hydrogenobacter thermophilus TK-6]
MGREISYICDACGSDCTEHYYIVSVVRRGEGHSVLHVNGDDPILCPECALSVITLLSHLEGMGWKEEEDEDDGF